MEGEEQKDVTQAMEDDVTEATEKGGVTTEMPDVTTELDEMDTTEAPGSGSGDDAFDMEMSGSGMEDDTLADDEDGSGSGDDEDSSGSGSGMEETTDDTDYTDDTTEAMIDDKPLVVRENEGIPVLPPTEEDKVLTRRRVCSIIILHSPVYDT